MKTAVIYRSQTGFTRKYAQWITEKTNADLFPFDEAKKIDFEEYDAIIFGSWFMAGTLNKLKWFKERIPTWKDKLLIVYGVGGSPIENPDIEKAYAMAFTEEERAIVKTFYCPGGFDYDKMSAPSKLMMKMFSKTLKNKKDKTPEEEIMANMISTSYDISDIKYINPILECLNA